MMRFDPSDPSRLIPVRWYFNGSNVATLPFPTAFSSSNWLTADTRGTDSGAIGEVGSSPRAWANGAAPASFSVGSGCGSAGDFLNGFALGTGSPRPYVLPSCCTAGGLIPCQFPSSWAGGNFATVANSFIGAIGILNFSGGLWSNTFAPSGLTPVWNCGVCGFPVDQGLYFDLPPYTHPNCLEPVSFNIVTNTATYLDVLGLHPSVSPIGTTWTITP